MRLGILGCGSIGTEVIEALIHGRIPGMKLVRVCDVNATDAVKRAHEVLGAEYTNDVACLLQDVDLILEASHPKVLKEHACSILRHNVDLIAMSVGAFAASSLFRQVYECAIETGRTVVCPSGALGGFDVLRAARSTGQLDSVTLSTTKNPRGLAGAPFFETHNMDLQDLSEKALVFEGNANEAIAGFPQNMNVAVALGLAGLGPERTRVRIFADPAATHTVHVVQASGGFGEVKVELRSLPSPRNPRTSYLAALSAIATLLRWTERFRVG